ncbi:hypothetical protein E4U55_005783 [Claviceps digitariae]|nr:hypothetical protein E4U55_005783 [Claviceps digitariae]
MAVPSAKYVNKDAIMAGQQFLKIQRRSARLETICSLPFPSRLRKLEIADSPASAAMAEGWCDKRHLPHEKLIQTYETWADGDWGLILTGNVQVDIQYLGQAEDNCTNPHVPRQELLETPVPVNLGHGIIAKTVSRLVFGIPREMTGADIEHVVCRFAESAKLCHEAGFSGIEIHGAHGYLLAQFLSAKTNHRTDEYGGSPKNRAKIVVDILRAVRAVVPKDFCVGIKLNSVDHQSEQELKDCIEQLEDIVATGIDFLEVSGGSYEDPVMMTGRINEKFPASTLAREAFFLEFAHAIRGRFDGVPLMVTGGFRTRKGMEAAIRDGGCDIIGIGRPAVLNPWLPKNTIFNKEIADETRLYTKAIASSWLRRFLGLKVIIGAAETMWYVRQIRNICSTRS